MSETNGEYAGRSVLLSKAERRYLVHEIDGVGSFRFQSLTAKEAGELADASDEDRACLMLMKCQVDAEGELVYRESDLSQLQSVDSRLINELCGVVTGHIMRGAAGN